MIQSISKTSGFPEMSRSSRLPVLPLEPTRFAYGNLIFALEKLQKLLRIIVKLGCLRSLNTISVSY